MKKILFLFIILFAGYIVFPRFVISENKNSGAILELNKQVEEKRNKIKQLEESIEEYKEKIAQKQREAVSLSNQLSILENRVSQVRLDITLTEEKLEAINIEIAKLELEIKQKEEKIERQKEITAELIRSIHKISGINYIEILTAYDSFSSFYTQLQQLRVIEKDLAKSRQNLEAAKIDLQSNKKQTEQRQNTYQELSSSLEQKKKDLEEQVFAKEEFLIQTKSSESTFQAMVSNLRAQYKAIENEITSIESDIRRELERNNSFEQLPVESIGTFSWPTASRYITARFHDKDYPYRHVFEHSGVDIRAAHGTALAATASGHVGRAKVCYDAQCYSYVMLIHPGGYSTVYGHMSKIIVNEGDIVLKGDIIGYSGGTPGTVGAGPFVTGPHLHLEIRKDGIPVDPLLYLVKDY